MKWEPVSLTAFYFSEGRRSREGQVFMKRGEEKGERRERRVKMN